MPYRIFETEAAARRRMGEWAFIDKPRGGKWRLGLDGLSVSAYEMDDARFCVEAIGFEGEEAAESAADIMRRAALGIAAETDAEWEFAPGGMMEHRSSVDFLFRFGADHLASGASDAHYIAAYGFDSIYAAKWLGESVLLRIVAFDGAEIVERRCVRCGGVYRWARRLDADTGEWDAGNDYCSPACEEK